MENVPNAMNSQAFKLAKEIFTSNGYRFKTVVLNAAQFHCPQSRKRMFCFGTRLENKNLDLGIEYLEQIATPEEMTVRDYIGTEWGEGIDYYWILPRNYNDKGVRAMDLPAPTIRGVHGKIPSTYVPNSKDATDDLSIVRVLTPSEVSRIQTFPKDWKWNQNLGRTSLFKMIGNAVAVNLANAIASMIVYVDTHS